MLGSINITNWEQKNKQNPLRYKLIDYIKFNKNYQQGLAMQNLKLNNKVTNLATQNMILSESQFILRKKNILNQEQLLRYSQAQQQRIRDSTKTISTLQSHKKLCQSRMLIQNSQLKREVDLCQTNAHELEVRMRGLQLQMKRQIQLRDRKIQQLTHAITMYEKQNRRLEDENKGFKLQLYEQELDTKLRSKNEKTIKNKKQIIQHNTSNEQQKCNDKQQKKDVELKNFIQQLKRDGGQKSHRIELLERQLKTKNDQIKQLIRNRAQRQEQLKDFIIKMRKRVLEQKNYKEQQKQDLLANIQQILNTNPQPIAIIQEKDNKHLDVFQIAKGEGIIASIITLRRGINKQIFQIFIVSLRQGQQNRSNALNIFLSKWRTLQVDRISPYVQGYMQALQSIIGYYKLNQSKTEVEQLRKNIQKIKKTIPIQLVEEQTEELPHSLGIKSAGVFQTWSAQKHKQKIGKENGRSQINLWVISTIQFTNNQHSVHASNINNNILYLFRLLTIQYRISYPSKDKRKQYSINEDVWNLLLHYVVMAVKAVIDSI